MHASIMEKNLPRSLARSHSIHTYTYIHMQHERSHSVGLVWLCSADLRKEGTHLLTHSLTHTLCLPPSLRLLHPTAFSIPLLRSPSLYSALPPPPLPTSFPPSIPSPIPPSLHLFIPLSLPPSDLLDILKFQDQKNTPKKQYI